MPIDSEIDIAGAIVIEEEAETQNSLHLRCGVPNGAFASARIIFISPEPGSSGRPAFVIECCPNSGDIRWSWSDGIVFSISASGADIGVTWPPGETAQSAAYYFTGPVLAFLLRRHGFSLLHGSVVTTSRGAIAFLGNSGAGKSTTAAAMVQHGFAAVTDDVIVLDRTSGHWCVPPGYAGVRLWQDSVEGLFGPEAFVPRLVDYSASIPGWDKRFLRIDKPEKFATSPVPLRIIYTLAPRTAAPPRIESLSSVEQLIELDINVFHPYLRDVAQKRANFSDFGKLLGDIPVKRLHAGEDLSKLPEVARLVTEDAYSTRPFGS